MSYLVLARKYRPRNFSEMVGQEHVVQALTNALTQQRLHHAYLFTGTRGVGKTTVSRILAKSLNCQGPDGLGGITASPCGVCQACQDIDSGRFVDYTELDAASNRGVDEVQGLLEQAVYKPVQGRFKVFMIDEVHMLTNTAFNAMLKTLEEPPEYLKFVLATTDPQKVPVTVLSRCLQFNLRPMAPETVQEHLAKVLAAEQIPAQPQALRLLSRAARGSMRDALSLTDQAIAFGSGQLQEAGVRQMLGAVDRTYVLRAIGALVVSDGRGVVDVVDSLRSNGLSAASTLEELTMVLQRMAVLQAVPDMAASVDAGDPEAVEIARLAECMPPDEIQLLYSMCLHGRAELGLAPDEYAALTMVLLRLLAFKPTPGGHQEKKTLNTADVRPRPVFQPASAAQVSVVPEQATPVKPAATEPALETADAPAPMPAVPAGWSAHSAVQPDGDTGRLLAPAPVGTLTEPVVELAVEPAPAVLSIPVRELPESSAPRLQPAPAASASVAARFTQTEEGDVWFSTVQALIDAEAIAALVRELALQSQLVARDGPHWLIRVERESLNQATARERLRAALEAAGHAQVLSVEIGVVSDSPARRKAAAAQARQLRAEEIVENDPYVQSLIREHGAKIVPGSIKPA